MAPTDDSLGSVLVIGGCGSLGHHIVKQMLEKEDAATITVFDLKTEQNPITGAAYVEGNISSREQTLSALQQSRPQVVFHTVSPKSMVQKNPRQLFYDVNVGGTENLLDCINEVHVTKALIYTSSSSVVHDNTTDLVDATEDLPLCFESDGQKEYYTHTKAVAEDMVRKANGKKGLLTVAVRAAMLIGEGDTTSTPTMVENARAGKGKYQVGGGTNLSDFTYIGNTAYGHILAAKALLRESKSLKPIPDDIKVNGEAFVITNDDHWPFWDFQRAMGARAGCKVKKEDVWVIPARVYYVIVIAIEWGVWLSSFGRKESFINRRMVKYLTMNRTFDISKAKRRLGYQPQVSVQEGINRAVDSYLAKKSETKQGK